MESYDDILARMINRYSALSGFVPKQESDIMLRLKVLAGEILNSTAAVEFVKQQMFASSASGEYLDKHAQTRGITRKGATKATGSVTFYVSEALTDDVVINKGTVVSTSGEDVRQFETIDTVTLKSGELNVSADVVALSYGSDYNVIANTVTVMVTPPSYIESVSNKYAFKGGVDAESDEQLRRRVLDSYRDISNSTNEIYYKRLVESVPGVYSSSVIAGRRGPGTLDVFLCGKGDAVIKLEQIEQAQKIVDENRELNVDVYVLYSTPVEVMYVLDLCVEDGYNFDTVSAIVKEKMTDYVDSVGVGNPVLLSDLGELIYHTSGVSNYSFYLDACYDFYPEKNEYCVVKAIDIRQVSR